jgi:hypothetical protein
MHVMFGREESGEGTAGVEGRRLYLFSSNAQPLYAQHALNILAMPAGSRTTLRYSSRWINDEAKDVWSPQLGGCHVLMHFALQQQAHYVEPAFFPLRTGEVVKATKEGEYHFVEVTVGDYVALKRAEEEEGREQPELAGPVDAYRRFLEEHDVGRPYASSAALGVDVLEQARSEVIDTAPPGDPDQLDIKLFRRNAEYLQQTVSFKDSRFVRFLRLTDSGTDDASPKTELSGDPPCLEVRAGHTYEIEIFSFQPRGVETPEQFVVSADGVTIQLIGRAGFEVASHYDRIKLPLRPRLSANASSVQALVVIEPGSSVRGPRIELPFEVHDKRGIRPATVAASVVSLGLIVSVSLASSTLLKVGLLAGGLALAYALQWFGRPIASLMGPAATALPAPQARPSVIVEASVASPHALGPHAG